MRNKRQPKNEEISQSVRDIIDSYGEPNPMLSAREWITSIYDFINAVLSEYYDVEHMKLNIVNGIISATDSRDFVSDYVRNINYGVSS